MFNCRFQMSVIFAAMIAAMIAAVIASGVLGGKGLLKLRGSLGYRHPIAVLAPYAAFLVSMQVWIRYMSTGKAQASRSDSYSFDQSAASANFDSCRSNRAVRTGIALRHGARGRVATAPLVPGRNGRFDLISLSRK